MAKGGCRPAGFYGVLFESRERYRPLALELVKCPGFFLSFAIHSAGCLSGALPFGFASEFIGSIGMDYNFCPIVQRCSFEGERLGEQLRLEASD